MRIPLSEATPSEDESGGIREGGCSAWQLPPGETCAAVARSLIRETLTALGMPADAVHDATTMVSELATNAFEHASADYRPFRPPDMRGAGGPLRPGTPRYAGGGSELWLYRSVDRLVCKVFDSSRRWRDASGGGPGEGLAEHGRGLGVVHVLSNGEWGRHLTRSRLGAWRAPGKAVYFRLPVAPDRRPDHRTAVMAAERLHLMLAARGLDRVYRTESAGQAVVSVCQGLAVRCAGTCFIWENASGDLVHRPADDLIDVVEEVVRRHEELGESARRGCGCAASAMPGRRSHG